MTAQPAKLGDEAARIVAISAHDRSLLVEAGAGSGKTAIMAGRIACMLTDGVKPGSIAAVTFTELAASELLARVRDFVEELLSGGMPVEMRAALPDGLDGKRKKNLQLAGHQIDDITCATIHGFCQRLIKPYPVEARIDPGASVMDRGEADRLFDELLDGWLRERLAADGELLAELVAHDPGKAVDTIRKIASALRRNRTLGTPIAPPADEAVRLFLDYVAAFRRFIDNAAATEKETAEIVAKFEAMAQPLRSAAETDGPAALVALATSEPDEDLCIQDGSFASYRRKGKWAAAAKSAGLSKADGDRMNDEALAAYEACCQAYNEIRTNAATKILADLVEEIRPLIDLFQAEKRRTASLDFDDLIAAAADLLRNHEPVRRALAGRFAHVLVDEFQDTDPLQTEIFWRLCGEPPPAAQSADWTGFSIRPGALFLVGDPKQAIYRFRGADVHAYLRAREALRAQDPGSVIQISTNFRSCRSILAYVNERFVASLSGPGQPGFTALDHFHDDGEAPCVAALDVVVPGEDGKATSETQRDCEAEAVAELCERMIGSRVVLERKNGKSRECRAGDIALLAPTGAELWRYEEALERRGIPVSTQAGKGLYRRQEMQDLIAIARVLADPRDTLAFGALLRGPLVGLTEEEMMDIVWALPRSGSTPERLPRLSRSIEPEHVTHELAREVLEKLRSLARRANSTTPHDLLSQAVDVLRVGPILVERYRGRAERALSNVDLFLELARPYDVRGLRAFAEAMTTFWNDETRAIEGRPDAQEEAVALYTMHAAKGLEWPIVVPINGMTKVVAPTAELIDLRTNQLHCPVFGVEPLGYETVLVAEKAELNNERVRLWYVATTRAKELLIVPRSNAQLGRSAWRALADLAVTDLPAIDVSKLPGGPPAMPEQPANLQTRPLFAAEAVRIAEQTIRLEWIAPSRAEDAQQPAAADELPVFAPTQDGEVDEESVISAPQGGRGRGLVIHKLFEEVLTNETGDSIEALEARATELIKEIGLDPSADPRRGLSPAEIARSVLRGLTHPKIAAVRPKLLPEFPVFSSSVAGTVEKITAGIADAIAIEDGKPFLIIDWKSDVDPGLETAAHYRAQVSAYLEATNIPVGLIVFVTNGTVIEITRPARQN
jgi:exodeoxyribonuclease-5